MKAISSRRGLGSVPLFVVLTLSTLLSGLRFLGGGRIQWQDLSLPLLTGTLTLALAIFRAITINFSARLAWVYLAVAVAVSWPTEVAGVHNGFPFGSTYRYHPDLMPRLPGDVPLFIPLSWFVLSGSSLIMLRGTLSMPCGAARWIGALLVRSLLSGIFVAGCDLVLDPLATSVKAWTWTADGWYFGIPLNNYLGWGLVGAAIHLTASLLAWRPGTTPVPVPRPFARAWLGANLSLLGLLVVASVERLPNLVPLALALVVVVPFLMAWWRGARREGLAAIDPAPCAVEATLSPEVP